MADEELQPLLPQTISPSNRRKKARMVLLAAEMFERLAWFSVSGTLIYFLTKEPLCWSSSLSLTAALVSTAVMYTAGLISGWLSDSYVGRYRLIIIGYIIYILGYWYFPVLAFYSQPSNKTHVPHYEGKSCNSSLFTSSNSSFLCHESIDGNLSPCSFSMFWFLILTAIGAGIVNTNLAPFGADQVSVLLPSLTEKIFVDFFFL